MAVKIKMSLTTYSQWVWQLIHFNVPCLMIFCNYKFDYVSRKSDWVIIFDFRDFNNQSLGFHSSIAHYWSSAQLPEQQLLLVVLCAFNYSAYDGVVYDGNLLFKYYASSVLFVGQSGIRVVLKKFISAQVIFAQSMSE